MFYEIEYDDSPIPGVGKFVLKKPQKITVPEDNGIRAVFGKMRDIARDSRISGGGYGYTNDNLIFYKQAVFMSDFTDDYNNIAPFSRYYPCYNLMGYEQLRTYFTWRAKLRKGEFYDIPVSYAFVYIYELLHNIGVSSPKAGLNKLRDFRCGYKNDTVDKYIAKWLKDYFIYYELPISFNDFLADNGIAHYYNTDITQKSIEDEDDDTARFIAVSSYKIEKSAFYTAERAEMIDDCIADVIAGIGDVLVKNGMSLESFVYYPTKKTAVYKPFAGAVFYPWVKQKDREIVISKNEVFYCKNGEFTIVPVILTDSGKKFIGCIIKHTEAKLREITGYKRKISTQADFAGCEAAARLREKGIRLDALIENIVKAYYREINKTIVNVNIEALKKIREEAHRTQEKLTVPEGMETTSPPPGARVSRPHPIEHPIPAPGARASRPHPIEHPIPAPGARASRPHPIEPPIPLHTPVNNPRTNLTNSLTDLEKTALSAILNNQTDLVTFAAANNIMPEILADSINEKAQDIIGDNILDEDFNIYPEYADKIALKS